MFRTRRSCLCIAFSLLQASICVAQAPLRVAAPVVEGKIEAAIANAGFVLIAAHSYELIPLPASFPHSSAGLPGAYFLQTTARFSGTVSSGPRFDILCGVYDTTASPPTFERTTDFDAINSSSQDETATVSSDLTMAMVNSGGQTTCYLRSSTSANFAGGTSVSALAGENLDLSLCTINGQWTIVFAGWSSPTIEMADLDPASASITNRRLASPLLNTLGAQWSGSPTVIRDGDEAVALAHCVNCLGGFGTPSWSYGVIQPMLGDAQSQPQVVIDSRNIAGLFPGTQGVFSLAAPAAIDGRLLFPAVTNVGLDQMVTVAVVGMAGATIPPSGGSVWLNWFTPTNAGQLPRYACWFAVSDQRVPLYSIPGILGTASLAPNGVAVAGLAVTNQATGLASLAFNVPSGILPIGTRIPAQPLFLDLQSSELLIGNSVELLVR